MRSDITASNFVSTREHAWRQLGTTLPPVRTAAEALQHGHLAGWNIRKEPMHVTVGSQQVLVPDMWAVVRDNPHILGQVDVLGTVGKAYHCMQNEMLTDLMDTLADESGATYESAGAFDEGKRVFVTMRMPGTAKVGGDQVDTYLVASTAHNGQASTQLIVTPVRVASQATLNMAFQGASNVYKVRHSSGAHKLMVQQAREALGFTFDYLDGFQEEADQLVQVQLTQAKFEQLIQRNFGVPDSAPAPTITRTQNKLDQMAELFSDSFTSPVGGTAWAGLSALTEWYDHYSPVRAAPGEEATARGRKALMELGFKNDAHKLMMELV